MDMVDLDDFVALAHGIEVEKLCKMLEIHPRTLKRWRSGEVKPPIAVCLLLRFINWGELSSLGGEDWKGFTIGRQDHKLYLPCFRAGFTPYELQAMFFTTQDAWQDKRDLKHVSSQFAESFAEIARLKVELFEAKERNAYYSRVLLDAGVFPAASAQTSAVSP
jgi:hypothetical protein